MRLDNPATDGQVDARSRDVAPMEAFEGNEDIVPIVLFDSDSIVLDTDRATSVLQRRGEVNAGRYVGAPILNRIANEVLDYMTELGFMAEVAWEILRRHLRVGLRNQFPEVLFRPRENAVKINGGRAGWGLANLGIVQKVVDEHTHTVCTADDVFHVLLLFFSEAAAKATLQEAGESRNCTQRLLKIVARNIGKLL